MDDISKKTVIVLVILTILISVISTWMILSSISELPAKEQGAPTAPQTGTVGVSSEQSASQPKTVTQSGQVSFTILKRGNKSE